MSQRLFGTDGVRGKAGLPPLDVGTIRRFGAALARSLPCGSGARRLLIGRDTRESGEWIERELAHGASGGGAEATSAGVISTPAVAFLTRELGFGAGVVISASHNPYQDNGIKVFSGAGEKFTEHLEIEIESIVADAAWKTREGDAPPLAVTDLTPIYLQHVCKALPDAGRLKGIRLAVDCANGATSGLAPRLFGDLGFEVITLNCTPDGRNINRNCGSTHPEQLATAVTETGCRLGVAFDGDGDRAIFVDHLGQVVNGDGVMLMCALHLRQTGRLKNDAIVATVMSNIGLEIALRKAGIGMVRCPVGDKYVMQEMIKRDLSLGGEQSGHIIFSDLLYTGDGLVTALSVMQTMAVQGRELAELSKALITYPQVLLNVPVRRKPDLEEVPEIAKAVARVEASLARNGRLLVRYSGTEPLLRIMLEGPDEGEIRALAEEIAEQVRARLS
jgi:phosphoglucosamine mutase